MVLRDDDDDDDDDDDEADGAETIIDDLDSDGDDDVCDVAFVTGTFGPDVAEEQFVNGVPFAACCSATAFASAANFAVSCRA